MMWLTLLIILLVIVANPQKLKKTTQNFSNREFLLFFAGIYGERIYIGLDYLLSKIPKAENFLFLGALYLIVTIFTGGDA